MVELNGRRYRIRVRLHGKQRYVASRTENRELAEAYDRTLRSCLDAGYTDIVGQIIEGSVRLSLVHELCVTGGVTGLRDRLAVESRRVNLYPTIAQWEAHLKKKGKPGEDTISRYVKVVQSLAIAPESILSDDLTPEGISGWLEGRSGRRKAYIAAHLWWTWCRERGLVDGDPFALVPCPGPGKARDRWLPESGVLKLLLASPEPARSAIAVAYGAGLEASVLVNLNGCDVDRNNRAIRARGTKTRSRDRWVRCAEYLWPYVERLLDEHGDGPLFPTLDRWVVSKAHRDAAKVIGEEGLRLHDSRHSFAVRLVRAGVPFTVVAEQLGHQDASMVMKVYGRYRPDLSELDRWERVAAQQG